MFQKKQQLNLYFFMVFVANSLQIACVFFIFQWFLLQIVCKNEEIKAICKLFATKIIETWRKHKLFATKTMKKYKFSCCNAFFLQIRCNFFAYLPAKIAFFRFCKICKKIAMQQLNLYYFMVFASHSLQIACVFFIFQWFLLQIACKNEDMKAICKLLAAKTIEKWRKHKLFATKTMKKYRFSCCIAIFLLILCIFFLQILPNLKNAIFAGRFARICKKNAMQQLNPYFFHGFDCK